MRLPLGAMVVLALIGVVAVLYFFPERDDPVILADVRCAATAAVLLDLARRLNGTTGQPDTTALARIESQSSALARRVDRLRAAGAVEASYLSRMIGEETRFRDEMIQSNGVTAWLDHARTRVDTCGGSAFLRVLPKEGMA